VEAARRLDVDLVVAAEKPNALAASLPDHLLTLPFDDPSTAAALMREYAKTRPIAAVVPVDDATSVVGAASGQGVRPRATPAPGAVQAAPDGGGGGGASRRAGVRRAGFRVFPGSADPRVVATAVRSPSVLKPLVLSASRGVMRADNADQFVAMWTRLASILADREVQALGEGAQRVLVEDFIPGVEVALEGLLTEGHLRTLAIFDKPDPLDGPFFGEPSYVTPSRLPEATQTAVVACAAEAAQALGLSNGPIHVELRINEAGPWLIELAARSIGGLCSRTLSFGTGMSLEEIIVRHALRWPVASLERAHPAAGVMVIPIRRSGTLEGVTGLEAARAVPGIEDITISMHQGRRVVPLPEGSAYLGFIFARGESAAAAEASLRRAHAALGFAIR